MKILKTANYKKLKKQSNWQDEDNFSGYDINNFDPNKDNRPDDINRRDLTSEESKKVQPFFDDIEKEKKLEILRQENRKKDIINAIKNSKNTLITDIFDLSVRTGHYLKKNNIITISDLLKLGITDSINPMDTKNQKRLNLKEETISELQHALEEVKRALES